MARYIDADKSLKRIKELQETDPSTVGKKQFAEGFFCGLDEAEVVLMQAPAADVAEVKHGYWEEERYIDEKWADFKCSVCDFDDTFYRNLICFYKYCPNCGAKMDGNLRKEG